ncbi:hypothetical protein D0T21_21985 [Duganella sp. BJB476]|nr:hypothetical protein D0T21_21985 [Duganella sp. BJB476]
MAADHRDHLLCNVLATIISEGDARIRIVGPLSRDIKDEMIHAYQTWFGRGMPVWKFPVLILVSILVLVGFKQAGVGWLLSFAGGVALFLLIGIPLSRRDSENAIARITARNPEFFDVVWSAGIVSLVVPSRSMEFDAREGGAWQDAILQLVGVPDLASGVSKSERQQAAQ